MPNSTRPLLEVIWAHTALEQIAKLEPHFPRLDEVWVGVEWALARKPEEYEVEYTSATGMDIHVLRVDSSPASPALEVIFHIALNAVTVLWVDVVLEDEAESA